MPLSTEELVQQGYALFHHKLTKYMTGLDEIAADLVKMKELEASRLKAYRLTEQQASKVASERSKWADWLDNFKKRWDGVLNGRNGSLKMLDSLFKDLGLDEVICQVYSAKMLHVKGEYPEALKLEIVNNDLKARIKEKLAVTQQKLASCDKSKKDQSLALQQLSQEKESKVMDAVAYYKKTQSLLMFYQLLQAKSPELTPKVMAAYFAHFAFSVEERELIEETRMREDAFFQSDSLPNIGGILEYYQKKLGIDLTEDVLSFLERDRAMQRERTQMVSSPVEIEQFLEQNRLSLQGVSLREREELFRYGNVKQMAQVFAALQDAGRSTSSIQNSLACLVRIEHPEWIAEYHDFCESQGESFSSLPLSCLKDPSRMPFNAKLLKDNGFSIPDIIHHAGALLFKADIRDLESKLELFRTFHITKAFSSSSPDKGRDYSIFNGTYKSLFRKFLATQEEGNLNWCQQSAVLTGYSCEFLVGLYRYCKSSDIETYSDRENYRLKNFFYSSTARKKELPDFTKDKIRELVPSFADTSDNVIEVFDNEEEVRMAETLYFGNDALQLPKLSEEQAGRYKEGIVRFQQLYSPFFTTIKADDGSVHQVQGSGNVCTIANVPISYYRVSLALSFLATKEEFDVDKSLAAAMFVGGVRSKNEMMRVKDVLCTKEKEGGRGPIL